MHAERQALVTQWEQSIALMQQRDTEIAAASDEFRSIKGELAVANQNIREQEDFLEQEQQVLPYYSWKHGNVFLTQ